MKKFYKIVAIILIQALLMINAVYAGAQDSISSAEQAAASTLSPKITLSIHTFKESYEIIFKNDALSVINRITGFPVSISERIQANE